MVTLTQPPEIMKNPKPINVNVTREMIEKTQAFQDASKMLQNLSLNRTNFKWIQHGVNVAVNRGFDQWNQQTNSSFTNRGIIQELTNKHHENIERGKP